MVIIALVFGLAGGLAGGILTGVYLADSLSGFSPFGSIDFSRGEYAGQGFIISNAKNVIVQQDAKVDETINAVSGSLVGIYKSQKTGKSSKTFSPVNFYKIGEPNGQGFILTSDGWIVTSLALARTYNDYVAIDRDKKIYKIDKAAVDSLTGLNFIHVQARDLPVRKFAESQSVKIGQIALAVNWPGLSRVTSIIGLNQPEVLLKSSDNFSGKLILNDKLSAEFKGAVIFNLSGEAVGLADDKGEIQPISRLSGAIKSLFKNQAVVRPVLGVNYINLDHLVPIDGQNQAWQKGAVLYGDQKGQAIVKNSPANKAGLLEGDVVLSVDDINLDKNNDLADVIQAHSAGEIIDLTIVRDGAEKEIKATLGAK